MVGSMREKTALGLCSGGVSLAHAAEAQQLPLDPADILVCQSPISLCLLLGPARARNTSVCTAVYHTIHCTDTLGLANKQDSGIHSHWCFSSPKLMSDLMRCLQADFCQVRPGMGALSGEKQEMGDGLHATERSPSLRS